MGYGHVILLMQICRVVETESDKSESEIFDISSENMGHGYACWKLHGNNDKRFGFGSYNLISTHVSR